MKKLKLKFVDFWTPFTEMDESYKTLYTIITENFPVEISDDPDYVICSCFGSEYLNYPDAVRILFLGENIFPNFNLYDYAIGFNYISFDDRYLRFPLYWLYASDCEQAEKKHFFTGEGSALKREFCGYVSSHVCDLRDGIFSSVNNYKVVSSGGPWMNNIGHVIGREISDKREFQKNYKFSLCSENSICNGYVTEKLLQGFSAGTVPIYLGAKTVQSDFNKKAFIDVSDFPSYEAAVEYIKTVDNDDALYLKMLREPAFSGVKSRTEALTDLLGFFTAIFSQNKKDAFRRHFDREWGIAMDINNQEKCMAVRQKYWRLKHLENSILQKEYNTSIYPSGAKQKLFDLFAAFFMK